jgi:DNA-binding transcriptional ArsR family regulator
VYFDAGLRPLLLGCLPYDAPPDYLNKSLINKQNLHMPTTQPLLEMDTLQYRKARYVLKGIDHPLRLKILRMIHSKGETNVTDIYQRLRLEQSVASQHLRWLRTAGAVKTRREGKQIFYSLNYMRLAELNRLITAFLS